MSRVEGAVTKMFTTNVKGCSQAMCDEKKIRKEMFYLMMHSTHFFIGRTIELFLVPAAVPRLVYVHIKEPLLLIGKSRPCCGNRLPLSLSEWSFNICLMPYNHKYNIPFLQHILFTVIWHRAFGKGSFRQ